MCGGAICTCNGALSSAALPATRAAQVGDAAAGRQTKCAVCLAAAHQPTFSLFSAQPSAVGWYLGSGCTCPYGLELPVDLCQQAGKRQNVRNQASLQDTAGGGGNSKVGKFGPVALSPVDLTRSNQLPKNRNCKKKPKMLQLCEK